MLVIQYVLPHTDEAKHSLPMGVFCTGTHYTQHPLLPLLLIKDVLISAVTSSAVSSVASLLCQMLHMSHHLLWSHTCPLIRPITHSHHLTATFQWAVLTQARYCCPISPFTHLSLL